MRRLLRRAAPLQRAPVTPNQRKLLPQGRGFLHFWIAAYRWCGSPLNQGAAMCQASERDQSTNAPKQSPTNARNRPLFSLGRVVTTRGALDHFIKHGIHPMTYVFRHQRGDWGEVCPDDAHENELSVSNGYRVLSAYKVSGERIWIITEWNRSSTTLSFPREY
jgi:hypothetical protein